jgi:hypothetical protein
MGSNVTRSKIFSAACGLAERFKVQGSRLKEKPSFVEQGFDCVKGTAETFANVRPTWPKK